MCYSSIRRDLLEKTLKNVQTRNPENKENYQIGLGFLQESFIQKLQRVGLLRNFVLLSPEMLEKELSIVDEHGIENVTIYCLGGLNKKYVEVLKEHVAKEDVLLIHS